MKRLIRPAALLFYLLTIIDFFFIGASLAGISGAADGQGLAGAAIVLGYGVLASFIALAIALFINFSSWRQHIPKMNLGLGIILGLFVVLFLYQRLTNQ